VITRYLVRAGLVLFVSIAIAAAGAHARAQTAPLPTIDQILDKYIAGAGGRAAIEKITSISGKGTIDIPDANISGTVELIQKAPDKALTIVDLPGVGQQREGYDGTVGWSDDPQNGLRQKSGVELAEAKRGATFGRELKMKQLYPTMVVKGREKVDESDAYLVEATPSEGSPVKLYFDATSGLLVRQIAQRQMPQGPLEVEVTFSDFRPVEGVKRPFTIRQATSMFTATIHLTEVKHNAPIDDAIFKAPK
jgi:outer membrane lipoprotein-sorting protein